MKKLVILLGVLAISAWATGAWATATGNVGSDITPINNTSTSYLVNFQDSTHGLNALSLGEGSVPSGQSQYAGLTTEYATGTSFSNGGSTSIPVLNLTTGGSVFSDVILLLSVEGPISSGFGGSLSWGSGGSAESFSFTDSQLTSSLSSYFYGPQTYRPFYGSGYTLYPGQTASSYLMFIDLGSTSNAASSGITYSFYGLSTGDVLAFNLYGWNSTGPGFAPNAGAGIYWTNKDTNGFTIDAVPLPPSLLLLASGLVGFGFMRKKGGKALEPKFIVRRRRGMKKGAIILGLFAALAWGTGAWATSYSGVESDFTTGGTTGPYSYVNGATMTSYGINASGNAWMGVSGCPGGSRKLHHSQCSGRADELVGRRYDEPRLLDLHVHVYSEYRRKQ